MQCELSGESLANAATGTVVVTPSGHVCRKDLLLTKLTENGSVDPFHPDRPLAEDDVIVLAAAAATGASSKVIPPRPLQATSHAALLSAVQTEYDAVVLELFDTRQALQDARQELSQALYQNDAAVRVIARLSAERDAARQQLQEWQASGVAAAPPAANDESSKKRKRDNLADALENEIPEAHLKSMQAVWESLHKGRKALLKSLKSPTAAAVKAYFDSAPQSSWTTTAIVAAAAQGKQMAVATNDNCVKVLQESQEIASFATTAPATVVDVMENEWIIWANAAGDVQVAKLGGEVMPAINLDSAVTDVSLHFDKQHALVATQGGKVCLLTLSSSSSSQTTVVSVFSASTPNTSYTAACLHPDGLIYVAGTAEGALLLWDLKSKSLAASMQEEKETASAVRMVQVSPNGYHIAAAHANGAVRIWDLRKQKLLATLTTKGATSVAFDAAGKFVLYGGGQGCNITAVPIKEWENVMEIKDSSDMVLATWSSEYGIIGAGAKGVSCYGRPS